MQEEREGTTIFLELPFGDGRIEWRGGTTDTRNDLSYFSLGSTTVNESLKRGK